MQQNISFCYDFKKDTHTYKIFLKQQNYKIKKQLANSKSDLSLFKAGKRHQCLAHLSGSPTPRFILIRFKWKQELINMWIKVLFLALIFQTIKTLSLNLSGIKLLFHSQSVNTSVNSLGRKAEAFYLMIKNN